MTKQQQVHLGVIGLGNIAQQHINNITSDVVNGCVITALSSRNKTALADELSAAHFPDYRDLIDSGLVDAVLIATPTLAHFDMASYALSKNIHVMLEKPIGLSALEGEKLVALANKNTKFALMLNQRTDPTFSKMKSIFSNTSNYYFTFIALVFINLKGNSACFLLNFGIV